MDKKTLLTVDIKSSDFQEVKKLIKNQQILIESQSRVLEGFINDALDIKEQLIEVRKNIITAKNAVSLKDFIDPLYMANDSLNYIIDFLLELSSEREC